MKELVEQISKALVDHPDDVQVRVVEGLSTFDLRSIETYDGRAAVVAAGLVWPLDAVFHPAV